MGLYYSFLCLFLLKIMGNGVIYASNNCTAIQSLDLDLEVTCGPQPHVTHPILSYDLILLMIFCEFSHNGLYAMASQDHRANYGLFLKKINFD